MVSVLLSASVERLSVSCMQDFFFRNSIKKQACPAIAPSRYPPGRLVPPGEALRATVEETNGQNFFLLYCWGVFYN